VQRYGQIWSWFEQERNTGRGKKKRRRKRRNNPLLNILGSPCKEKEECNTHTKASTNVVVT
jgi:hypothetical protein